MTQKSDFNQSSSALVELPAPRPNLNAGQTKIAGLCKDLDKKTFQLSDQVAKEAVIADLVWINRFE
jgi:hypothetical protein